MMLELCRLSYTRRVIDLTQHEHRRPEFLRLNPAGAIPTLVDHDGPGGKPFVLTQSGAICLYLANKAGCLLPDTEPHKSTALQWFMHAITDVGMLATSLFRAQSCGEAESATAKISRERLAAHLRLVDARLAASPYLAGDISIADIALYPILLSAAVEPTLSALTDLHHLARWRASLAARPEIARGM